MGTGPSSTQSAPSATMPSLQDAFGPDVLVPLREGVLSHASVMFGVLPLNNTFQAEDGEASRVYGVVCGGKPGLLALAFGSEETAGVFLRNNQVLGGTLATRLQQTVIIWLRPQNQLPPSVEVNNVRIISEGIVPVYEDEGAGVCSVFQNGKPLCLDLGTLSFPEGLRQFFVGWVVQEQFGPPLLQLSRRRKVLNEAYWAAGISKLTGLQYETTEEVFRVRDPKTQKDVILGAAAVFTLVARLLKEGGVPPGEFRRARIEAVVETVKVLCAVSTPTFAEEIMKFVHTRLEVLPAAALNKNLAATACRKFLQDRFKVSENKLRHAMSQAIQKHFGIGESHDQGRVFYGLALPSAGVGTVPSPGPSPGPPETMQPKG